MIGNETLKKMSREELIYWVKVLEHSLSNQEILLRSEDVSIRNLLRSIDNLYSVLDGVKAVKNDERLMYTYKEEMEEKYCPNHNTVEVPEEGASE